MGNYTAKCIAHCWLKSTCLPEGNLINNAPEYAKRITSREESEFIDLTATFKSYCMILNPDEPITSTLRTEVNDWVDESTKMQLSNIEEILSYEVLELEVKKEIYDECDEDSERFSFDLMKSCEYDRAKSVKTIQAIVML
ncbi:hypothetical protein SARC_12503 [Sphaeroforma arctica JP610]|uniref:Uncharacterized protein n=1 Tax=Sphaeroforma arctica JP610 TaxID=667725 RepID=A0A0L0FDX7_9EUKA|nr:hypothetical protein SARC_12503 [Sphaeroforma arctica JP610]KNC74960.1 hypothetical protein SARC_12503 [Sphaeroforma arctica JP610]|eukprot:XP_014148862.1 hypothetical protein SARC_12503 [Sphaeroforma arctica JP610]